MPNLAQALRQRVLDSYPQAVVVDRGNKHLLHRIARLPDGRDRFAGDYTVGSLHYHDGIDWQEINTDWQDSDNLDFSDKMDRSHFKAYVKNDASRRIYFRRLIDSEYVDFGLMEYWDNNRWRSIPAGTKNRSADKLSFDGTNVSLELIATSDQLKIHFILKDNTAPTRVRWPITLTGIHMNGWAFVSDNDGETVGYLPYPYMTDAAHTVREVTINLGAGYVEYQAETTGLVYPIDIDPTITPQVGATADDGQQGQCEGDSVNYGSWDMLQAGSACYNQICYLARFTLTGPPSGSTADVAYLTFRVFAALGDVDADLDFEDIDDSPDLASVNDIRARTRTGNAATWTNASLSDPCDTPSLTSSIGDVLARAGWTSGQHVSFIGWGRTRTENHTFGIYSWNEDSAKAPVFHLEYTEPFIIGTVCWGHSTGVTQLNTRTFAADWTGTATASGAGDAQILTFYPSENMESKVVQTGVARVVVAQNVYQQNDNVVIKYRHGASVAACQAASWSTYTVPFVCLGFMQVRLEATV